MSRKSHMVTFCILVAALVGLALLIGPSVLRRHQEALRSEDVRNRPPASPVDTLVNAAAKTEEATAAAAGSDTPQPPPAPAPSLTPTSIEEPIYHLTIENADPQVAWLEVQRLFGNQASWKVSSSVVMGEGGDNPRYMAIVDLPKADYHLVQNTAKNLGALKVHTISRFSPVPLDAMQVEVEVIKPGAGRIPKVVRPGVPDH